jgi:hypothetical protein
MSQIAQRLPLANTKDSFFTQDRQLENPQRFFESWEYAARMISWIYRKDSLKETRYVVSKGMARSGNGCTSKELAK